MTSMQLSDEEYFYKLENMIQTSAEKIRRVFLTRWKKESGKNWEHTEEQGKKFIKGMGYEAYYKADPIQKSLIATGCPDDWDICILSLVIQNMGQWSSYKVENEVVRRLKCLRNGLAHHPTRKITQQDHRGKVAVFRKSLKELGTNDEEIEEMITNAGISCSEAAFKMAKKCYDKARRRMAKNNFNTAIIHCNEAITLPSLLPFHLAVTYENRAECYLKFGEHKRQNQERSEARGYIAQAIKDGTKALELNENSWKAHYVIGRGHQLNGSWELAIKHYTLGLAISPLQKHMWTELNSCKYHFELVTRGGHLDPNKLPKTLRERVVDCEVRTGCKVSEKQYLRDWKRTQFVNGIFCPGHNDVVQGEQYRSGLGVLPNDAEAARFFAKAAESGNPEGMVELGSCYLDGIGAKQDPSKALELFQKAAKLSLDTKGMITALNKNTGVVSAQFSLGVMYDNGIAVDHDAEEAARWYKKAADNGCPSAATNLASHYRFGEGIEKNEKMAEHYWYFALVLGDLHAAGALMDHYMDHKEPEKAYAMFQMWKNVDPLDLNKSKDAEFKARIDDVVLDRSQYKVEVEAFENELNLSTKGFTFLERLQRKLKSSAREPHMAKLRRIVNEEQKGSKLGESDNEEEDQEMGRIDLHVKSLGLKAKEGSVTACSILQTRNISRNLIRFVDGKDTFSDKQKNKVLNMLYECVTREFQTVFFKKNTEAKLKRIIDELNERKQNRMDEDEMKIRLVYVMLNHKPGNNDGDDLGTELLKQGIKMYPKNVHYYEQLCKHVEDVDSTLLNVKKGLDKFPDNVNLLFFKAMFMQRSLLSTCQTACEHCWCEFQRGTPSPKKKKPTIDALQKFLKVAPKDYRYVPFAYYTIAMVHMIISSDLKQMEEYYKLGLESEKNMLPCYSSMYYKGNCIPKTFVEEVLYEKTGGGVGLAAESSTETGILERRQYLDTPLRRWVISEHRERINRVARKKLVLCYGIELTQYGLRPTPKPKIIQSAPNRMCEVKPITLREMNPTTNHVYEDRVIDFTIIDVPLVYCRCPAIHLIVEDEYGDVTHLNIFNMENTKDDLKGLLGLGSKIAILNPCMQIGTETVENGIQNNDPDCIIYLGEVENICRFCSESVKTENVQKCGKCLEAVYCSKECQEHDWKIMKHKLICFKNN